MQEDRRVLVVDLCGTAENIIVEADLPFVEATISRGGVPGSDRPLMQAWVATVDPSDNEAMVQAIEKLARDLRAGLEVAKGEAR